MHGCVPRGGDGGRKGRGRGGGGERAPSYKGAKCPPHSLTSSYKGAKSVGGVGDTLCPLLIRGQRVWGTLFAPYCGD